MWCPKCKDEYREEFTTCPVCATALTQQPETKEESEPKDIDNSPAFLTSVADITIARMIESKLKAYEIPVLIKYKGSGEYLQIYMGSTPFGVDLYVPASVLEQAKELIVPDEELASLPDIEEEDTENTEDSEEFEEDTFDEESNVLPEETVNLHEDEASITVQSEESDLQREQERETGLPSKKVGRRMLGILFAASTLISVYAFLHMDNFKVDTMNPESAVSYLVFMIMIIIQIVLSLNFLFRK